MTDRDYTITARFQTGRGGSLFCQTAARGPWIPDGKTLFVRGGKLVFDIGWVGAVSSRQKVADNRWHHVAMTWQHATGAVRLFVDGKLDAEGQLRPKSPLREPVVRIGFTSANFPAPQSHFVGELAEVTFSQRALSGDEIARLARGDRVDGGLVAQWQLAAADEAPTGTGPDGRSGWAKR